VHTQFSLLDGAADIKKLMKKAKDDEMKAIAITDHGNMFGAFRFVAEANAQGVKPIVGCEFYMVEDRHQRQFTKEKKDKRYHQLLLAKNDKGYQNLSKLCSYGYKEGLYSKWPRIDKELLLKYHEGLIATSCCLGAEIPQAILNQDEAKAEELLKWWLDVFGEDFYIEIQRHSLPDQEKVNVVLLKFAKKYNVKIIASNDSHYVEQEDANAHDLLLCINTADLQQTPKATDEEGGKGYRFGFPNEEFYFKSQGEMAALFSDIPEAVWNTEEVVDKIDHLDLNKELLLPAFPIPSEFSDADEYLKHLTYEGARERYSEITAEIEERLNFELFTIKSMGFPGYFLIVADFIKAGRDLGVYVGPGRGSAAGSAVAYCMGITNIDPLKYGLLFERFLNPERKSMPDIDTDFDDFGRQKVLDYVIDKYGYNQVAQVVTYGTMASKSSIKDVARALNLPLNEAIALTKLVPDRPGSPGLGDLLTAEESKMKKALSSDDFANMLQMRELAGGASLESATLKEAMKLEGSVRNTGIHACAVIIAPSDLTDHIPLSTSKNSELWVTQYDGNVIEDSGLLKMDFLGLKTLTILKNTVRLIKQNHDKDIILDEIPLDDPATFELFQKGDTISIFQYESEGMQKVLRDLKPDRFEELIAVNALYRPGPMDYIPLFVDRKHGRKEIEYDFEAIEDIMSETYGITVYQEQVMLAAQKLASFSKGDADGLRKAMGKKKIKELNKLADLFFDGCEKNGHDLEVAKKVWNDWKAFASYAFNKSHATCYAYLGFQTAYLKSHYPSEYMAAVLNNAGNIETIAFFMEECKRMGITVLGPDLNESFADFAVNKKGEIRFGLGSIKGSGEKAVDFIIEEREEGGPFEDIFDLCGRVNLRSVNKRVLESLAKGGAFDFDDKHHRAQYFKVALNEGLTGIDIAIKHGIAQQANAANNQASLFGGDQGASLRAPTLPEVEAMGMIEELRHEREVVGMYISGHPLDLYGFECNRIADANCIQMVNLDEMVGRTIKLAGIITQVEERVNQQGTPWGKFILEDYVGSYAFNLYKDDYAKYSPKLKAESHVLLTVEIYQYKKYGTDEKVTNTKLKNVEALENAMQIYVRSIAAQLDWKVLDNEKVDQMVSIIEDNNGDTRFNFKLFDTADGGEVELGNENLKVKPSIKLVEAFEAMGCKMTVEMN